MKKSNWQLITYALWLQERGINSLSTPLNSSKDEKKTQAYTQTGFLFVTSSAANKDAQELFQRLSYALKKEGIDAHIIEGKEKLDEAIQKVSPDFVLLLGKRTLNSVFGDEIRFRQIQSKVFSHANFGNTRFMVTFDFEDLLRHASNKRLFWNDVLKLKDFLGSGPCVP